ncbi:MAG: AAA family ATPase [Planctomycetes bacterium]|nr:AAA family ATPase [Planctomycetota bacterium]MCH9725713.1 AAA family ATPase [Planctomycetota bacterium]MCH9777768.1 AAA family ATPase [Planctomycetota bacterium]MCH9790800.1 AAA family ATPase [Planctomycetota bacterium]MDF1743726.1 DnaA/Hda family protein [Gimesia sp.]
MSKPGKQSHHSTCQPFKILKENAYAHTAVSELLSATDVPDPQLAYIYGPSGYGKSALISSELRTFSRTHPDAEFQLITASEFAAKFAAASSNRRIPDFQKKIRSLNLLVMEDIQSLENRNKTQRELLSVIDEILKQGGRIILSSTKPPGELARFHKKLVNRFHGGICALIDPLKFQSRLDLLSLWATSDKIPLQKKELSLIAQKKALSPRELHALLIQLQTVSRINQKPMNSSFVKQYLEGNIEPPKTSIAKITKSVCKEFKISIKEIRSANRSQQFVLPRQCAMFLSRELTQDSLEKIALYFNRKNHSTVIHACRQIQNDLDMSPGLRQQVSRIKQQMGVYLF